MPWPNGSEAQSIDQWQNSHKKRLPFFLPKCLEHLSCYAVYDHQWLSFCPISFGEWWYIYIYVWMYMVVVKVFNIWLQHIISYLIYPLFVWNLLVVADYNSTGRDGSFIVVNYFFFWCNFIQSSQNSGTIKSKTCLGGSSYANVWYCTVICDAFALFCVCIIYVRTAASTPVNI